MTDPKTIGVADVTVRDLLQRIARPDAGPIRDCAASLVGATAAAIGVGTADSDELRDRLAVLETLIGRNADAAERLGAAGEGEPAPLDASLTPVQTISESLQVLEVVDGLLRRADPDARADLGTALALAHASIMGAYLAARRNIERVPAETIRAKARTLIDEALLRSSERVRETMAWLLQQLDADEKAKADE